MPGLTHKDHTILRLLKDYGPMQPAEIGQKLGQPAKTASAHVARPLKRLRDVGLVERTTQKRPEGQPGGPLVLYSIKD